MRTVVLAGPLGKKFGRLWSLDVRSPAEAVRAIEANRPGFARHLVESGEAGVGYRILVGRRDLPPEALSGPFGERERLTVVPVVAGAAGGNGTGKIIAGVLLVALSFVIPGGAIALSPTVSISAGSVAMMGVALALGGVSQLMAKPPDLGTGKPNPVFSGPVNTIMQGGCGPVGYGRMTVGSRVICAGIWIDELTVPAKDLTA